MTASKTVLLALSGVLILAACGGSRSRPSCDAQENAQLTIEATDRMNPDEDGRPLPTIVRVYQLANINVMETASFDEIWRTDEDTLGDAFLGKDELTVYPDTRINREFERNPDANYIVGMAVVRRPTGQSWRTILQLPPPAQEAQCAALQDDPDAPPPEQPTVYLRFEIDDYQIEGAVRLEYPPPPCEETDLICIAEREAAATMEDAQPEAPETPEAPGVDAPSTPSTSAPSAPAP
ncbi:MAG: type VI secretion system lipoprotein TssJ [Sandaracinaceae bacterium]